MRGRTPPHEEHVEIDPATLSGLFAAPRWLRDVGFTAWLVVGVGLFVVGSVSLLALTNVIVVPVIAAGVIAAVAVAAAPAFETIIASGPNSAKAHHRPSTRQVQPGDFVIIDFGAIVDGYRIEFLGNAARTFDFARDELAEILQVNMAGHELCE